jgi:hypothetical protein
VATTSESGARHLADPGGSDQTRADTNVQKELTVPIAADYPFLEVLWSMLVFMGFFMWVWLAVMCFGDVFRRHDIGGFVKAVWIILIIFLPLVGVLVYLIAYHRGIAERTARSAEAAKAAFDQQVREAAGKGGPATEIETARKLLDAGTITEAEFAAVKARALGGASPA